MKKLAICLAAAAVLAAPALADTLQHVTTKGIVLEIQGMAIPVTYNADGTLSGEAMGQAFGGAWRIEGSKLCSSTDFTPDSCTEYPADKVPGDSFEVTGADGSVAKVTINK
jgi:hypothetical protein